MMETYEQDHMLSCLRDRVDDKLCLDAASEIAALKASNELLQEKLEFAEFEWNRATDGMQERDACIEELVKENHRLRILLEHEDES